LNDFPPLHVFALRRKLRMRRKGESGQVLPLIAICLTAIMGFAGMSVDIGYWEYHQREQQSAADAAALGGAQQLAYAGCPSQNSAQTAAYTDVGTYGYTNGANGVTVAISNPPATPSPAPSGKPSPSPAPYTGNPCAVSAQVTGTKTATFFTKLFGHATGATQATQATALLVKNDKNCIFLLSQTATLNLSGVNITAPGCGVAANSAAVETSGDNIDVASFGYAHTWTGSTGDFSSAKPMKMLPVADPCPEISGCAYTASNKVSYSSCTTLNNQSTKPLTVSPGCYSSFNNSGGTVTMSPGQYEFTGSLTQSGNQASLSGTGVTLYVSPAAGTVALGGNSVTLSAPTTGSYANVLFYQDPGNSTTVQLTASNVSVTGLLYAPAALGQVDADISNYAVLVFANMDFDGTMCNGWTLSGPTVGNSIIQTAVLGD
jgi:Putative Flp pilus-assembly TadE/G-like